MITRKPKILKYIELLLCARHWFKGLMCINSFIFLQQSRCYYYSRGNWGTERLKILFKVTESVRGGVWIWAGSLDPNHYYSITSLSIALPSRTWWGQRFGLSCSRMNFQSLEQSLAHSKHSINFGWKNKWKLVFAEFFNGKFIYSKFADYRNKVSLCLSSLYLSNLLASFSGCLPWPLGID